MMKKLVAPRAALRAELEALWERSGQADTELSATDGASRLLIPITFVLACGTLTMCFTHKSWDPPRIIVTGLFVMSLIGLFAIAAQGSAVQPLKEDMSKCRALMGLVPPELAYDDENSDWTLEWTSEDAWKVTHSIPGAPWSADRHPVSFEQEWATLQAVTHSGVPWQASLRRRGEGVKCKAGWAERRCQDELKFQSGAALSDEALEQMRREMPKSGQLEREGLSVVARFVSGEGQLKSDSRLFNPDQVRSAVAWFSKFVAATVVHSSPLSVPVVVGESREVDF